MLAKTINHSSNDSVCVCAAHAHSTFGKHKDDLFDGIIGMRRAYICR